MRLFSRILQCSYPKWIPFLGAIIYVILFISSKDETEKQRKFVKKLFLKYIFVLDYIEIDTSHLQTEKEVLDRWRVSDLSCSLFFQVQGIFAQFVNK